MAGSWRTDAAPWETTPLAPRGEGDGWPPRRLSSKPWMRSRDRGLRREARSSRSLERLWDGRTLAEHPHRASMGMAVSLLVPQLASGSTPVAAAAPGSLAAADSAPLSGVESSVSTGSPELRLLGRRTRV